MEKKHIECEYGVGRGGEGGIVTNETRTVFIYFCEFLYEPRVMSEEGEIVTVETRKNIHTIRADGVASLRNGRLERKNSELYESRNGKEGKTYLGEKLMIQCLDVKVVRSKYEDTKQKEENEPGQRFTSQDIHQLHRQPGDE